jgi:glutamate/tyrosine decarboxylase-like PLP-dependent enzyme
MDDFSKCEPLDVSLKTFFLGPQAENREWVLNAVQYLFQQWFQWRQNYYPLDGEAISLENRRQPEFIYKQSQLMDHLKTLIRRFEDEVPKFTPRYVGHMLSELSLPALLGHIVTLLHNPNNISGEASRVGIKIEREAIEDLCSMIGWERQDSIGHFTSGGTIANFEGLLRAKNRHYQWLSLGAYLKEKGLTDKSLFDLAHMGWQEFEHQLSSVNQLEFSQWKQEWLSNPIRFANHVSRIFGVNFEGPVVLVSQSKHYSWPKGTQLLGMGSDRLISVNLDDHGRMDVQHLKEVIESCRKRNTPISCIVSVAGTTEMGTVDPIDKISLAISDYRHQGVHFWHHVDAAYGGFLCSMRGMQGDHDIDDLLQKLDAVGDANSITIDPHKLGYVPYASGVILVKNRREYAYQEIHAPYIQFDPAKDVGLQTLEGSRSAAGAVATWLTERSIGLNADGYGRILARTIAVRKLVQGLLVSADSQFVIPNGLDTNVLCFSVAKKGQSLSEVNHRVRAIYEKLAPGQQAQFIISKTSLRFVNYHNLLDTWTHEHGIEKDSKDVDLLRLCLMNPFIASKETNVFYPEALISELKSVSGIS